jgi:hypothetical protein
MYCLGKLPVKHDPRTLMLRNYVGAVDFPVSKKWSAKPGVYPMYANDRCGCCGIAGPAHLEQVWRANDGDPYTPADGDVLAAYKLLGGWDGVPGSPSDQGVIMLNVMNYWRNHGLFGRRIAAYAKVDHTNRNEVKKAIYLFGGVVLGLSLPAAVQEQTNDQEWRLPGRRLWGQWSPGTWGGHCTVSCDYDAEGIPTITWGGVKGMSWDFFEAYCDECYVALGRSWVGPDNKAPNGFDAMKLTKDLGLLR